MEIVLDFCVCDGEGHAEDGVFIIEHVIVLDLLVYGLFRSQKTDDLVSLGRAIYLFHDGCSCRSGNISENFVSWEKLGLILAAAFFLSIHADFNAEEVSLEQLKDLVHVCFLYIVAYSVLELLNWRLLLQLDYHRGGLEHV